MAGLNYPLPPFPPSPSERQAAYVAGAELQPHINDQARRHRISVLGTCAYTILTRPVITTAKLAYRAVKLLTWDLAKAGLYKISGHHTESATFLERQYLKTVKVVRDLLFIPSVIKRAIQDVFVRYETFANLPRMKPVDYLHFPALNRRFEQFSSYLHGLGTFEVICPQGIKEFPAVNDPNLHTIMASHLFKPGVMAINFGCPNVATFVTEEGENGSVQTIKVDAKSLKREPMHFHPTNGKMQSGVFLVPTNLPAEALNRFKAAAHALEGRADITCVNTNCRVLKEAGFSIEGVAMDGVILPNTLMEHLLFRHVFYTDSNGVKSRVHFDVINTTAHTLETFFENVDTAVVGTRLRHRRRNADTPEQSQARGVAAKALIAEEARRLAEAGPVPEIDVEYLKRRKVNISVPSFFGDLAARVWGRHTIYELDLSDKWESIKTAFERLAEQKGEPVELRAFPHAQPSRLTRLKRDIFFSGPVVRFLRRHMMGRVDTIDLHAQDIFNHLKSTQGQRLNYAVVNGKMVVSKVQANAGNDNRVRQAADWALSKHAILANREGVYCSGEMWYDEAHNRFMMNSDSGTYIPSSGRVELVAQLANEVFESDQFGVRFEAAPEPVAV